MAATRRNQQLVNLLGGWFPADNLQALLANPAYDTAGICRVLGVSLEHWNWANAQPVPISEKPLNWTASPGVGQLGYNPGYVGVTAIAFSHAWFPGYTFGTPVYANI